MASLFKCQTCHKEFSAEHVLEAHLEDWKYRERLFALARERCRVHCDPDDEADYEQSEPLKADQCPSEPCGMKFSSTSNVKRHFRKHVSRTSSTIEGYQASPATDAPADRIDKR